MGYGKGGCSLPVTEQMEKEGESHRIPKIEQGQCNQSESWKQGVGSRAGKLREMESW